MHFILAQYVDHSFKAAQQAFLLDEILTLYGIKAINELMIHVLIFLVCAFNVLHTSQITLNAQVQLIQHFIKELTYLNEFGTISFWPIHLLPSRIGGRGRTLAVSLAASGVAVVIIIFIQRDNQPVHAFLAQLLKMIWIQKRSEQVVICCA